MYSMTAEHYDCILPPSLGWNKAQFLNIQGKSSFCTERCSTYICGYYQSLYPLMEEKQHTNHLIWQWLQAKGQTPCNSAWKPHCWKGRFTGQSVYLMASMDPYNTIQNCKPTCSHLWMHQCHWKTSHYRALISAWLLKMQLAERQQWAE